MIKILRNKTYQGMINEKVKLEHIIFDLSKDIDRLHMMSYNDSNKMEQLNNLIKVLIEDKRKLASAKGGLNAKIKRLENKIKYLEELQIEMNKQYKELEEKYKESMTDKYLVKKLKPGRTPKTTSMKLKDCSRVSNITRKVISHYEKDM